MSWINRLVGKNDKSDENRIKSFEEEIGDREYELKKLGKASIKIENIVGSVGRAHELDKNFQYRKRARTERYYKIEEALQIGKPLEPIKVFKLNRGRADSEYYIVDGHHRVAQAKQHGYDEINADVTEVVIQDETQNNQQSSPDGQSDTT